MSAAAEFDCGSASSNAPPAVVDVRAKVVVAEEVALREDPVALVGRVVARVVPAGVVVALIGGVVDGVQGRVAADGPATRELHGLDAAGGEEVWTEELPAGSNSGMTAYGNSLIVPAGLPLEEGQVPALVAYSLGG